MEKSIGEFKVRTDFNVGGNSNVDLLKIKSAELLNIINALECWKEQNSEELREFYRLKALAMTAIEEGAMWAVKAATA